MSRDFLVDLMENYGKVDLLEVPQVMICPIEYDQALIAGELIGEAVIEDDSEWLGAYSLLVQGEPAAALMNRLLPYLGERLSTEVETILNDCADLYGS